MKGKVKELMHEYFDKVHFVLEVDPNFVANVIKVKKEVKVYMPDIGGFGAVSKDDAEQFLKAFAFTFGSACRFFLVYGAICFKSKEEWRPLDARVLEGAHKMGQAVYSMGFATPVFVILREKKFYDKESKDCMAGKEYLALLAVCRPRISYMTFFRLV